MGNVDTVRLARLLATAAASFFSARASVWHCSAVWWDSILASLSDRAATLKLVVVVSRGVWRLPKAKTSS